MNTIDLGFIPIFVHVEIDNGDVIINEDDCKLVAEEVTRRVENELKD